MQFFPFQIDTQNFIVVAVSTKSHKHLIVQEDKEKVRNEIEP